MYGNLNGSDALIIMDILDKQNKKIRSIGCCSKNTARRLNGKIIRLGIAGFLMGYLIESQIIDLNKRLKTLEQAKKDEEVLKTFEQAKKGEEVLQEE